MNDEHDTTEPARLRPTPPPGSSPWRTYGPLALVLTAMAGVVAFVASSAAPVAVRTDDGAAPDRGPGSISDVRVLPPGVETYARAAANGTADEIDWGERCDTSIGKLKLPQWPQPDCFAPFRGDNGGATETGVTDDTIKVVLYQPMPDDPVLKFIYAQIGNDDTIDEAYETYAGFTEIFNTYYELYGRKVELSRYIATGPISDPTAATADAETIARDLAPFAVIGGPNLTNAFADTLAANEVMCISCTPPQPAAWYAERAPYVWDVTRNADQTLQSVVEYLGKRLHGRPARFAGDEAMHRTERVFGLIHVVSSDSTQELVDRAVTRLRDEYGMEFAAIQSYGLPTELSASGKDIITKMKEAGVTTVVFSGDPLGPQTLTTIATSQDYFPEWVLGAVTLVDTSVFARTYDQRQWAHAFGPTGLFARTDDDGAGPGFLYKWFFGRSAPARGTVPLIAGPLQVLFGGLQGVGPELTHDMFQRVLFGAPIYPSTPISAQVSYGNRGFFPDPDYSALDDATEIWWDPDAEAETETGTPGKGAWRFVDGGKRILPGEWPTTEPNVFDPDGAVTGYDAPPPGAELPDYEPLRR